MFNIETTKDLSKLYYELHSVNLKIHNLTIEQEVFANKDYASYLGQKHKLELDMLLVVQKIGKASEML